MVFPYLQEYPAVRRAEGYKYAKHQLGVIRSLRIPLAQSRLST